MWSKTKKMLLEHSKQQHVIKKYRETLEEDVNLNLTVKTPEMTSLDISLNFILS